MLELDHKIFISNNEQLFIAVYVNDLFFFGANISRREDI